jgi:hypothetical protein
MIPNGTKVRVRPRDPVLKHIDGLEGVVVSSYVLPVGFGTHKQTRHYLVLVNGLDYDLTADEMEVV